MVSEALSRVLMVESLEKLQPTTTKSGRSRSQVGKSSKSKGKAGERFFADILIRVSGLEFIRVPNSGAFVGQSNRERLVKLSRTQQIINLGDIICPEELTNAFIFESKNYADLDFHNLINEGSKTLNGWLGELLYDCESYYQFVKDKKPMLGFLCVKITRKGSWAIINSGNANILGQFNVMFPYLSFLHQVPQILKDNGWNDIFYMFDFEKFISANRVKLFAVMPKIITNSNDGSQIYIYNDEAYHEQI